MRARLGRRDRKGATRLRPAPKQKPIKGRRLKGALRESQVLAMRRWLVTRSPRPVSQELVPTPFYPVVKIAIDGEPIYSLDIDCTCCDWLFEREAGTGSVPTTAALAELLRAGVANLDDGTVAAVAEIVPDGAYRVVLLDLKVRSVNPGDPDDYFVTQHIWEASVLYGPDAELDTNPDFVPFDPSTGYYRDVPQTDGTIHLVLPLCASDSLDEDTMAGYARQLREGGRPTVAALTMVTQTDDPIAHVVIDGHHKLQAAALTGIPIRVMAFVMPY